MKLLEPGAEENRTVAGINPSTFPTLLRIEEIFVGLDPIRVVAYLPEPRVTAVEEGAAERTLDFLQSRL